jgi:hypothetical protein
VSVAAGSWPEEHQVLAAALFDVLWSVEAFERLVGDWRIEPGEAIGGLAWVIGLLEQAVRSGEGPGRRIDQEAAVTAGLGPEPPPGRPGTP